MSDKADLGDAVPPRQPTRRPPGSNPNKDFAQRRKANRPKTRNSSSPGEAKADSFRWIDPLPTVDPMPAALEPIIDSVPAAYITQRFELPTSIGEPFADTLGTVLDRTSMQEVDIEEVQDSLRAMTYFKAARQLYSTMSDPDKSELQPLKAVYYDSTEIPTHMSAAISMIGNLDTKIGQVEIRDAPVLFRRWVAKGLSLSPDTEIDKTTNCAELIWRTKSSKKLIDRLANEEIERLRATTTFEVTLDDASKIDVGLPPIPVTDAGYNMIPDAYPEADTLRDLIAIQQQTPKDYIASKAVPHGRDFDSCLTHIGLTIAPNDLNDTSMRNEFEDAMRDYITTRDPHIKAIFKTGPAPTTGSGFAAQIVQSDGVTGRFKLPLSDGDRALGYMFSPSIAFELQPSFVMYGRRRVDDEAARFAASDLKSLGTD